MIVGIFLLARNIISLTTPTATTILFNNNNSSYFVVYLSNEKSFKCYLIFVVYLKIQASNI